MSTEPVNKFDDDWTFGFNPPEKDNTASSEIDLFDGLFGTDPVNEENKKNENNTDKEKTKALLQQMISKKYNNDAELNVFNDKLVLPINKTFGFKNIHILNGKILLNDKGLLDLQSLNDIILENSEINLKGQKGHHPYYKVKIRENNKVYGRNLNQIFMGKKGSDFGEGSGGGGGGIRLICKNRLILKGSTINISGSPCCENAWDQMRCGGRGENGSCLIICNELIMDQSSKICDGRVVIKMKNVLTKQRMNYLFYGYLRHCNRRKLVIADIYNLCVSYYNHDLNEIYNKYNIKHKPLFVDDSWKVINNEFVKTDVYDRFARKYNNYSDSNGCDQMVGGDMNAYLGDDGFFYDFNIDPFNEDIMYNGWNKKNKNVNPMDLYKVNKGNNINNNVINTPNDVFSSFIPQNKESQISYPAFFQPNKK